MPASVTPASALSDSELRARMIQRGCAIPTAYLLVANRERPWAASLIRGWLAR